MYLVVGADGFLGSYIVKNILRDTQSHILATARNLGQKTADDRIEWISCDITDYSDVERLNQFAKSLCEPLKVAFCAAYHNPDAVEAYPRLAWEINVTCLSYFLNTMENVECFFYPSTDSVYGESVEGYHFNETDALDPVNTYGRQKVVAEEIVRGYGYNVVRFPFLIAHSICGKKHFYDKLADDLRKGKRIQMFCDSRRSALNFDDAARILVYFMENYESTVPKTLNISGDDDLSKYDIGLMLADKLQVDRALVQPISLVSQKGIFHAPRPANTLLDNRLLKNLLGCAWGGAELRLRL